MNLPETPRYSLEDPNDTICPWCQDNHTLTEDDCFNDDHFECLNCGKSFDYVVDDKGGVFMEGMTTEKDQKYVDWLNTRNLIRFLASQLNSFRWWAARRLI